jgi:gamma-glutamylputrescine oxidase
MRLQPWWYARTPIHQREPLRRRTNADVVVIGGGIAGLHAALHLVSQGTDVVLLEKSFCGGGMSGRSSGFLTPDSELSLYQLVDRFGASGASSLWTTAAAGVKLIAATAETHGFRCDLQSLDSLFVGIGRKGAAATREESAARATLGYEGRLYDANALASIHPGGYAAGVRYGGTWAVDPFAYCQALRAVLISSGVRLYEGTEVVALEGTTVVTAHGSVHATNIVMTMNQVPRRLNPQAYGQYCTAQTCLAISQPLSARQIACLFPEDRLQCWDNRLLYSYYRLTGDNRLLVGGGSLLTTVADRPMRSPRVIEATIAAFIRRFPKLGDIAFETYWPGLIDVTRDLLPIADVDPASPSVHVVIGCAGLPWAAWCGDAVARRISGETSSEAARFFRWDRQGFVPRLFQRALGKPVSCVMDLLAARAGVRR